MAAELSGAANASAFCSAIALSCELSTVVGLHITGLVARFWILNGSKECRDKHCSSKMSKNTKT